MFKIGSRVFLTKIGLPDAEIGTVVKVILCDSQSPDFTSYDVDFASGLKTVHGTELRLAPLTYSCNEKALLCIAHKNALDMYKSAVLELADMAGRIAHTEFEFLRTRTNAAKRFVQEARERLDQHTAKHGC